MIYVGTTISVVDNTNVKTVRCIRILKGRKKFACVGDIIVTSVKEIFSSSKIKEGDIYKALVIRTRKNLLRRNGSILYLLDNAVVLINKDNGILGTRIFGPVPREIKNNCRNLFSISQEII